MARKALARTSEAIELDQGETLHGWYRTVRMVNADGRDQTMYDFQLIDALGDIMAGKIVSLWGCSVLDDLLLNSSLLNVESWVTYQGKQGRMKMFRVEQDTDRTDGAAAKPVKPAKAEPAPEGGGAPS